MTGQGEDLMRVVAAGMAFPLVDRLSMRDGPYKNWEQNFANLVMSKSTAPEWDEIVRIRQMLWPEYQGISFPTPLSSINKIAKWLLEPEGIGTRLRQGYQINPKNQTRQFPSDWNGGTFWFRVSRLICPEILAIALWTSDTDIPHGPDGRRYVVKPPRLDQLERIIGSFCDHHIHSSAAVRLHMLLPCINPGNPDIIFTNNYIGSEQINLTPRGFLAPIIDVPVAAQILHGVLGHVLMGGILRSEGSGVSHYEYSPLLLSLQNAKCWWRSAMETACPQNKETYREDMEELRNSLYTLFAAARCPVEPSWFDNGVLLDEKFIARAMLAEKNKKIEPVCDDAFSFLLNRFLIVRNHIYRGLTQQSDRPGLSNFKRWFNRIKYHNGSLPRWMRSSIKDKVAVVAPASHKVPYIEFRAGLGSGKSEDNPYRKAMETIQRIVREYYEYLVSCEDQPQRKCRDEGTRICFSLSFVKNKEKAQAGDQCTTLFHNTVNIYKRQARALIRVLEKHPEILFFVRGLDICNHEKSVPNWVPGLVYHWFRENLQQRVYGLNEHCDRCDVRLPVLRNTFHAGEDFDWPMQGLRFMQVCVDRKYGFLREGDRFGHGSALGINVKSWAQRISGVYTTIGSLFDDLVWEWGQLTDIVAGEIFPDDCLVVSDREAVAENIARLLRDMKRIAPVFLRCHYDNWNQPEKLWMAFRFRHDYTKLQNVLSNGDSLIGAGEWFDRIVVDALNEKEDHSSVEKLYFEYLTMGPLEKVWDQPYPLSVNDVQHIRRMQRMQRYVRKQVADRGIGVEVCPSSNFTIVNFGHDMTDHPMFNLCPVSPNENADKPEIKICINSDDPITFNTTTVEEYGLAYDAALKIAIEKGNPQAADDWIQKVHSFSEQLRFHADCNEKELLEKLSEDMGCNP